VDLLDPLDVFFVHAFSPSGGRWLCGAETWLAGAALATDPACCLSCRTRCAMIPSPRPEPDRCQIVGAMTACKLQRVRGPFSRGHQPLRNQRRCYDAHSTLAASVAVEYKPRGPLRNRPAAGRPASFLINLRIDSSRLLSYQAAYSPSARLRTLSFGVDIQTQKS